MSSRAFLSLCLLAAAGCGGAADKLPDIVSCGAELDVRPFATERADRFQGKVAPTTARCRGGSSALARRNLPWVDWSNYWAAGDETSKSWLATKNLRGIHGALVDLEFQRVELIRFNLFDNSGTYGQYVSGRDGVEGPALRTWPEMRLPPTHSEYRAVGAEGEQVCRGALVRARTLTGICNDVRNPLMGSTGMLFGRNVTFESTFPERETDSLARNRHGGRISLTSPDPQVVSRRLFTRTQSDAAACNLGKGRPDFGVQANCDYQKAPFFNALAAYWIQFMTHDWFSHMEEGHNAKGTMPVGCATLRRDGREQAMTAADVAAIGCRPADRIDPSFVADSTPADGRRAPKVFQNNNTAWWDASQLYGYDAASASRVRRDPRDRARLEMPTDSTSGAQGLLPSLRRGDAMLPDWAGQESVAFADNWSIGLSFLHNLFAREHNAFVAEFRKRQQETPLDDSGLRDPATPARVIRYRDVTDDELFNVARLVIAAEIAKIHTVEWTTQLLYNEPLYRAMNSNWNGFFESDNSVTDALAAVVRTLGASGSASKATAWYSVLAGGPGIIGLGSRRDNYDITNPDHLNGGVNHFGSPFNFPEEFVSVYRLHPLLPDLLEYRTMQAPNEIREKVPVVATFRGRATPIMHERGLTNWALSLGRQRLGLLTLQNSPAFIQNLSIDRLSSSTRQLDVVALDILRDRERGVPRYNEFRRQYGLRQITSFDDFIDGRLPAASTERKRQETVVAAMRETYGQHRCNAALVITRAQRNPNGLPISDCLGHPDGTLVDNVEDLDNVVGFLAETVRPHGFAISETQFLVFILNASRRLFSDRFFTSSFRAEFYSNLGMTWVRNNGPTEMRESVEDNGRKNLAVSPLKRVLLRAMPELAPELEGVMNAFDPWARDRGSNYSLAWKPKVRAASDPAFR